MAMTARAVIGLMACARAPDAVSRGIEFLLQADILVGAELPGTRQRDIMGSSTCHTLIAVCRWAASMDNQSECPVLFDPHPPQLRVISGDECA